MTAVGDILSYLETLAPRSMKMDWDNVGLLCGGKNRPVTKVLVALDPFEGVCHEAAQWGAELILTHHPSEGRHRRDFHRTGGAVAVRQRHQRHQRPHQLRLRPRRRQRLSGPDIGSE